LNGNNGPAEIVELHLGLAFDKIGTVQFDLAKSFFGLAAVGAAELQLRGAPDDRTHAFLVDHAGDFDADAVAPFRRHLRLGHAGYVGPLFHADRGLFQQVPRHDAARFQRLRFVQNFKAAFQIQAEFRSLNDPRDRERDDGKRGDDDQRKREQAFHGKPPTPFLYQCPYYNDPQKRKSILRDPARNPAKAGATRKTAPCGAVRTIKWAFGAPRSG